MFSRLACTKISINPALLKSAIQNLPRNRQIVRQFAEDARFKTRSERINERLSLREKIMAPAGPNGKLLPKSCVKNAYLKIYRQIFEKSLKKDVKNFNCAT